MHANLCLERLENDAMEMSAAHKLGCRPMSVPAQINRLAMSFQGGRFCVNTIAIIGGGPSGIAAAKSVLCSVSPLSIFDYL